MGKLARKKTSAPKRKVVRKKPVTLSYSKTIIITMGVLFLTLFLFVFEAQKFQEQRSGAATTNCDVPAADIEMSVTENNLLQLINQYRQSKGAPALTSAPALNQSAAWMSADMNSKKLLSHTDSLGRNLQTRLTQCGFSAGTGAVGENVAQGTGTDAQEIFDLWKTSTEGHNEEMLNPSHKVIGIGQSGMYWTADFADSAEGAGATAPEPSGGATAVTPSFFPLAPCPTCTTPQETPPVSAAAPAPTTAPVTVSGEPVPSAAVIDPCEGDTAYEDNSKHKKKKSKGGSENEGFIQQILQFLLQLIQKLIELLGGSAPATPGEPQTGGEPTQPCDPLPSTAVPAIDPGSASPANSSLY